MPEEVIIQPKKRGPPKGVRYGGRQKGTPNKTTQARLRDAKVAEKVADSIASDPAAVATVMERVRMAGFRGRDKLIELAIEVEGHLRDFNDALLARRKPGARGGKGPKFDLELWQLYRECAKFYGDLCDSIADFQDPRLRATLYVPPAPIEQPRTVEGKVIRMGNAIAASRAYQQLMQAPRQLALPGPKKAAS